MKKLLILSIFIAAVAYETTPAVNKTTLTTAVETATKTTVTPVVPVVTYKTIPFSEVKKLVESNSATVLDVRTPEEIQLTGTIKGAVQIPLQDLNTRLKELDKNKTYITFCRSGNRSEKAATLLIANGFKKIYNSDEGMNTWPYPELIQK